MEMNDRLDPAIGNLAFDSTFMCTSLKRVLFSNSCMFLLFVLM